MLKFLADEDFNNKLLRGLQRADPKIDFTRIQDVGVKGAHDRNVLDLAAELGRVLLTHDVNTMVPFAKERLQLGKPLSGILFVSQSARFASVIEDIVLTANCYSPKEIADAWLFIPLR